MNSAGATFQRDDMQGVFHWQQRTLRESIASQWLSCGGWAPTIGLTVDATSLGRPKKNMLLSVIYCPEKHISMVGPPVRSLIFAGPPPDSSEPSF